MAALAWPAISRAQSTAPRRTLHNGIVLAEPWPPRRAQLSAAPERPPYLASPPAVINIDIGRQLFVDDFLIEESSLHREFHQARYHPGNPVLRPERPFERHDPYAAMTGTAPSASAMLFSDGVFYDPADRLFKMWYMAGYQQHTALAMSRDGLSWERPSLDVVPGTNIVSTQARDSNTVWLDLDAANPGERFKMAGYDLAREGAAPSRVRRRHPLARGWTVGAVWRPQHVLPQSVSRDVGLQPARRRARQPASLSPLPRSAILCEGALGRCRAVGPAPTRSTSVVPT